MNTSLSTGFTCLNSYLFIPLYSDCYEIFVQFFCKHEIVSLDDVAVADFVLDGVPVGCNNMIIYLTMNFISNAILTWTYDLHCTTLAFLFKRLYDTTMNNFPF